MRYFLQSERSEDRKMERSGASKILLYFVGFFITISIILLIVFINSWPKLLGEIFSPISVVSKVSPRVGSVDSTDGKTNFLIVGIDKRSSGPVQTLLTDTIIVVSVDLTGKGVVMTSIPRDLWVEERKSKINAVYAGSYNASSKKYEIEPLKSATEKVVGLPIHYYAIVGFDAFVEAINVVGGIKINVQNAFDDYQYPIEGRENAEPESTRYEHIRFNAGEQVMDGETALKFARSRHATVAIEAGDFARSRRQQDVMAALKDKILSTSTLANPAKLLELYDAYKDNVDTNFDVTDIGVFFSAYGDVASGNFIKIVLSDEIRKDDIPGSGLLKSPTEEERHNFYFGQYVLVPVDPSFNEIHALIRSHLFKE